VSAIKLEIILEVETSSGAKPRRSFVTVDSAYPLIIQNAIADRTLELQNDNFGKSRNGLIAIKT